MKILISSATIKEIEPLLKFLKARQINEFIYSAEYYHLNISLVITGIGVMLTTFRLLQAINAYEDFDIALNLGLCGAFPESKIQLTEVVNITEEYLGDLGVKEGKTFKTIFDIGLMDKNEFPFTDGKLVNPHRIEDIDLFVNRRNVKSITVNSVSSEKREINLRRRSFDADVENMEGAAFFYVMLYHKIKFAEIRAVSNFIEKRDKEKWQILSAISKLNESAEMLLMNIAKDNFKI